MTGIVVVGTGFGYRIQLPALRAAGFEVLALVGRDAERTARRASRKGVPHACVSLAEALALPGADAVAIATPPSTHAPLLVEALTAGRHVLCEKPFAVDASEAQAMLDAAEHAGTVHLVGHEFRFSATQATMQRVLDEGQIGEPRFAAITSFVPVVASRGTTLMPDWFFERACGGGWLRASGSHSIDRIRCWLGEIESVSASMIPPVSGTGAADDSYALRFTLASGASGTLTESGASWLPEVLGSTVIVGSAGAATIVGGDVVVGTVEGRRIAEVRPDVRAVASDPASGDLMSRLSSLELEPYTRLCRSFLGSMTGREPVTDIEAATFHDGLAEMLVIDAVERSAADGGSLQHIDDARSDHGR